MVSVDEIDTIMEDDFMVQIIMDDVRSEELTKAFIQIMYVNNDFNGVDIKDVIN